MILILALPTLSAEITNLHIEVCQCSDKNFCLSQINYFLKSFPHLVFTFCRWNKMSCIAPYPHKTLTNYFMNKTVLKNTIHVFF